MLRIAEDRDEKKKKSRPASGGGQCDRHRTRVVRRLEQRISSEMTTRVACKAQAEPQTRAEPSGAKLDRPTCDCAEAAMHGRRTAGE